MKQIRQSSQYFGHRRIFLGFSRNFRRTASAFLRNFGSTFVATPLEHRGLLLAEQLGNRMDDFAPNAVMKKRILNHAHLFFWYSLWLVMWIPTMTTAKPFLEPGVAADTSLAGRAIRDKWKLYGRENGMLGASMGSFLMNGDRTDTWYMRFQQGVVFWSPRYGAKALRYPILRMWQDANGELGLPIDDERSCGGDNSASYAKFEGGTIFIRSNPPGGVTLRKGETLPSEFKAQCPKYK